MNRRNFLKATAGAAAVSSLPSCALPKKYGGHSSHQFSTVFRSPPAGVTMQPFDGKLDGPLPTMIPPNARGSYSSCQVNGPVLAMTFDDGPHVSNTPRLLDMLKEWKIRATFFMVGKNVVEYPNLVRRIVAEGHEVANHSWSHPNLMRMSDDAVRQEISHTHQAIVAACGVVPLVFRPPYGALTLRQKVWIRNEFGYPIILWDVDPNDWRDRDAGIVSRRILSMAKQGSIILSHDIHKTTIDAMPNTLPVLQAKGLQFATVSQLICMESGQPMAMAKEVEAPAINYGPGSF